MGSPSGALQIVQSIVFMWHYRTARADRFRGPGLFQLSEGRSTLSMTSNSPGPLAGSSFKPSCSRNAVRIDGPESEVTPGGLLTPDTRATSRCGLVWREFQMDVEHLRTDREAPFQAKGKTPRAGPLLRLTGDLGPASGGL